jgi:ATP-dependent Clp protease protease subunit
MTYLPNIMKTIKAGKTNCDLFTGLLEDRIIFLTGEIDTLAADSIVAQLLYLESQDPTQDIYMYINSPGGDVTAGMAIYDTMQYIKPAVVTICLGMAASMAAVLLMAGAKGKRYTLPNATVMIHQPLGGVEGKASDIAVHVHEIMRVRTAMLNIMAKHTGQALEQITRDTERDYFMTCTEAKAYGIVDQIVTSKNKLKEA